MVCSKPYRHASHNVKSCLPDELSNAEIERCVAIIRSGEAVDPEAAAAELPLASALAVARRGSVIVGVGAIKRVRIRYASRVAKESGFTFDPKTPELGYVAVDENHRRQGLSHRILEALVAKHGGKLFVTTDSEGMKKTLAAGGFEQQGREWEGNRGQLSLWIKP